MKLGIISDTHGRLTETLRAVELFRRQGVSVVIHCGDIGGPGVVRLFQGLETHFVLGNNDFDRQTLVRVAEETGNTLHGWFGSLELEGRNVCFMHGHDEFLLETETRSGDWNLLCFGHTHQPTCFQHDNTLLINPGAFQRVSVPSVAVMTLPEMTLESFAVLRSYSK